MTAAVAGERPAAPHARPDAETGGLLRLLAAQALSRAGGAPLVAGNEARILKDAREHFPAFLAAVGTARQSVFVENYIFADDGVGRELADALLQRAKAGVKVRVLCDWLGSFRLRRRFWQPLVEAGGEVRWFNPPSIASPLGALTRDHRKMLAVDGRIGFVTGLCISGRWLGDPAKGIAPWRDTGVCIRGPAVADIERAFAQTWAASGASLPAAELTPPESIAQAGDVALRVLPAVPSGAGLYRLDQLIAAMAHETLWLTDAYFVGVAPYVQALRSAALDGVDVRLLVPGSSDLRLLSALSRSGYRPLLEAGVRVFEWNGSMLHAKTAVADGRWARIGSSNLNVASWLGNYELDVAVEDARFAAAMQGAYEEDLHNATEIVLDARRVGPAVPRPRGHGRRSGGSVARAAAGALRIGNAVGAAIGNRRILGAAESGVMAGVGVVLLVLATLGIVWPLLLAAPLVLLGLWAGIALLVRAYQLRRAGRMAP
jgi:cardiolipin synthase